MMRHDSLEYFKTMGQVLYLALRCIKESRRIWVFSNMADRRHVTVCSAMFRYGGAHAIHDGRLCFKTNFQTMI